MIRSRLFWKIYLGYVGLVLFTAIVIGTLAWRRIELDLLEESRNRLEENASLLREIGRTAPGNGSEQTLASLRATVKRIGDRSHVELAILAPDGRLVAATDNPILPIDASIRPGESMQRSASGNRVMMFALPFGADDGALGFAIASLELDEIDQSLRGLRTWIALGAIIASSLALVLGVIAGRWFTHPLISMSKVAQSIAGGRLEERLEINRRDEVGALARSFNEMSDQLRGRIQTITDDRNKLFAVLGSMVEGVIAVDRDERILHVNAVASRILRIPQAEYEGRPVWEVVRIADVSEIISLTLAENAEQSREILVREGGQDRIIEMYSAPILGSRSEIKGAVVVLHDVTKLRRLEGIRREFVANVSHELKTPLTVIRGFIETMLDDPNIDDATRIGFLERMRVQSDRLSAIVADLLTLSRVESGQEALRLEPVDLTRIARMSVQALAPSAERKKIALNVRSANGISIMGDEHHLRLMIDNLLDNAVKYTPEGGRVTLAVTSEGKEAHLEVRDTGIGIEPVHRERIFERFYRVDKGRSRELGGTGLGLSIVKHVVLAHGGEIRVESMPGKGSTFQVTLPRESLQAPPTSAPRRRKRTSG
jgi:two-component system phosphate regulon sensor histidine kinase PhoR